MNSNFFKKIFAIPNYLALPTAGIEICNNSIKYVEFFNKKGVLTIKNFGEVYLAPGIFKDGDILNRASLVKALSEVKSKITSDFVKVSIPEEKTYIFDIQIPKEAKSNIREALEFKIEENVPLKLGESYFEYEIVDEGLGLRDMILSVSIIPKRVIADFSEVLEQANLYPISYEMESKMIADSIIKEKNDDNCIIVHIKDDSTVFVAVIKGFVRITSTVAIGENNIRENLLKTSLFSDELVNGKFFESDFSFETVYTKELYGSLVNIFSILKDEVEKFNNYIVSKFPDTKISASKGIDKIILSGRSSTLPGLAKHINQTLNTEIVSANAWANTDDIDDVSYKMKFSDSLSYVTPIGLVVSSNKEINA